MRDRAGQHCTGDRPWRPGYGPARPNREGTPVPARNWYVIIAVVAIVIVLAYLFGLFGHGAPPATTTTTPPAAGTTKYPSRAAVLRSARQGLPTRAGASRRP